MVEGAFTRTGIAVLLGTLLLGSNTAQAVDSAADAPYPLPGIERKVPAKPVHARRARRPRPTLFAHVPLPPMRPPMRQTVVEASSVSLPPEPMQAPPAPPAGTRKEMPPGWRLVTDPATGVLIGLPNRLFTQARDAPHGTLWSSPHGEVQVETFRIQKPDWKALYDRMKSQPASRRAQSNDLQNDSFSISGMQGLKDFAVHATQRDGEARGFTVVYDQAMEGIVAPIVARMTSAFIAFPEASAPFALPAKTVDYGTGVIVSERGDIVTSTRLTQGCAVLLIAGIGPAERVATEHGIALLRVFGAHKLDPISLSEGAAAGPLHLVGVPDPREQGGGAATREQSVRLTGNSGIALDRPAPIAGFAGAAVIDAQDRFAGLIELAGAQLAGNAPSPPLRLIDAAAIRRVLETHGVRLPQAATDGARNSVMRVICVRK